MRSAFANNMSTYIKLSKAQLSKSFNQVDFLVLAAIRAGNGSGSYKSR